MKKILTSFALVAASLAFAQVGINAGDSDTNEIAPDAVFHVKNKGTEKKGVVLPSVSLTSATDKVTTSNGTNQVTTGLMVWNDGLSALKPAGYYYWDGAKWLLTGNVDSESSSDTPFPSSRTVVSTSDNDLTDVLADNPKVLVIVITGSGEVTLPAASLYPGKVISINNNTGGNATYASGTFDAGSKTTTIRTASAHLIWSNGINWYCLSSRNG